VGRGRRRRSQITRANRRLENYRQWKEGRQALSWMGRRWTTVYDREKGIGSIPSILRQRHTPQPDFDPEPTEVRIHPCRKVSNCKARGCSTRATLIAEKLDGAGRHLSQIELCLRHCDIVIERERARGLEISDRRATPVDVASPGREDSSDRSSTVLVYTDGACFPNPGRGGWGARIVYSDGTRDETQGSASGRTTSSRMEMTAVLMGLRAVTEANHPVIVRSDSQYVIRTLCGRYRRHKNFDLWKDIDREVARFSRIRF
jgi:ribonuclease HI